MDKGATYQLGYFVFKVVVQNLRGHYEQIFDVFSSHCRCLESEGNIFLALEFLYSIKANFSLVFHVQLVSYQEEDDIGFALVHNFVVPRTQIVESLKTSDIVR